MDHRTDALIAELLHREWKTPEEWSRLLGIGPDAIRHAVFAGKLWADILAHDILRVHRQDVLSWLDECDGSA